MTIETTIGVALGLGMIYGAIDAYSRKLAYILWLILGVILVAALVHRSESGDPFQFELLRFAASLAGFLIGYAGSKMGYRQAFEEVPQ